MEQEDDGRVFHGSNPGLGFKFRRLNERQVQLNLVQETLLRPFVESERRRNDDAEVGATGVLDDWMSIAVIDGIGWFGSS